mmetsp:Transcript_11455/g.19572  ORF Transcript_11455/g.19572 Transcript_11455/m.19572 type:complete len:278 (+) Transcript_11455:451-1284(+)
MILQGVEEAVDHLVVAVGVVLLHLDPVDHDGQELVVVHHPLPRQVHGFYQLLRLRLLHAVARSVEPLLHVRERKLTRLLYVELTEDLVQLTRLHERPELGVLLQHEGRDGAQHDALQQREGAVALQPLHHTPSQGRVQRLPSNLDPRMLQRLLRGEPRHGIAIEQARGEVAGALGDVSHPELVVHHHAVLHHCPQHLLDGPALILLVPEGQAAAEELVDGDPRAPVVGLRAVRALHHLRRQVGGRPAAPGQHLPGSKVGGQAEVSSLKRGVLGVVQK